MDLFLDTSFIILLIIETDTTRRARDFFSSFSGTCAVSMNKRVTGVSGNPVMASRNKTRSLTGRDEDVLLSPVQRMRERFLLWTPK
jgi:hypothetical protein